MAASNPVISVISNTHTIRLRFSGAKNDNACPARVLNIGKNKNAKTMATTIAHKLIAIVSIKNWYRIDPLPAPITRRTPTSRGTPDRLGRC